MRVPRELLRIEAEIRDYQGAGSRGPSYAAPRTVRASLQRTDRLMQDARGVQVAVQDLAIVRPEDGPVPAESRVTAGGQEYRVVRCYAMPDDRRPYYFELELARFAPAAEPAGSGS